MRLRGRSDDTSEVLHVVLDEATVERLRCVAARTGLEVEQLIVRVIRRAGRHPDELLLYLSSQGP